MVTNNQTKNHKCIVCDNRITKNSKSCSNCGYSQSPSQSNAERIFAIILIEGITLTIAYYYSWVIYLSAMFLMAFLIISIDTNMAKKRYLATGSANKKTHTKEQNIITINNKAHHTSTMVDPESIELDSTLTKKTPNAPLYSHFKHNHIIWAKHPIIIEFTYINLSGGKQRERISLTEASTDEHYSLMLTGVCCKNNLRCYFYANRITTMILWKSKRLDLASFMDEALDLDIDLIIKIEKSVDRNRLSGY
ncbi:hypothetical protein [Serratia marcescens]|uniref:hypothetical protein n=1 Tax=Serratia marcescens TaxID=615 RepID=UPI004045BE8E